MNYSIAIPEKCNKEATDHLIRLDDQEDLCFALYYPSIGKKRSTAIVNKIILPQEGEREVHGNVSFNSVYFERVLGLALENNAGIVLMHSHLTSGWQGMSEDDEFTENTLAPSIYAATGFPFVGMTVGKDGSWSARFWKKLEGRHYKREWCEAVRVVGEKFTVTFNNHLLPKPTFSIRLQRTIDAWGKETQADLSRLRIGIVGAGSVGSFIGEALSKIGIENVKIIDFDTFKIHNLDRTPYTSEKDVGMSKALLLARNIRLGATNKNFKAEAIEYSIVEEEGFLPALDCDIIFSCVDRPWPRFILNFIAYAHLIPVVDGGIFVRTNTDNSKMIGADWRSHAVGPGRVCLECIGQYDPSEVSLEKEGYLDDPVYIAGLPKNHGIHQNQNVYVFSLGAGFFEMQQFLSMVIAPCGIANPGPKIYHFTLSTLVNDFKECTSNCLFSNDLLAKGDYAGIKVTGKHVIAEKERQARLSKTYSKK
jgi:molybdopterin/thiamine biosynthesis adenylyltransferase